MASNANIPGKLEGVLLCGGRSLRMGRDKALLQVEGKALWLRQRQQLKELLRGEPLLSVRTGTALPDVGVDPRELRYVYDDGSSGPLGGILAALETAESSGATHLAVLAVDMPFMETTWWTTLMRTCDAKSGAVGKQQDDAESWEPLAAIYPASMLELFRRAKTEGKFSLQKIVSEGVSSGRLAAVRIQPAQEKFFRNWNTPEDIA